MQRVDLNKPGEKKKIVIAAGLGLVAIVFLWWALFGFGGGRTSTTARPTASPTPQRTAQNAGRSNPTTVSADVKPFEAYTKLNSNRRPTVLRKRSAIYLLITSRPNSRSKLNRRPRLLRQRRHRQFCWHQFLLQMSTLALVISNLKPRATSSHPTCASTSMAASSPRLTKARSNSRRRSRRHLSLTRVCARSWSVLLTTDFTQINCRSTLRRRLHPTTPTSASSVHRIESAILRWFRNETTRTSS